MPADARGGAAGARGDALDDALGDVRDDVHDVPDAPVGAPGAPVDGRGSLGGVPLDGDGHDGTAVGIPDGVALVPLQDSVDIALHGRRLWISLVVHVHLPHV